jgi:hypothetical protein
MNQHQYVCMYTLSGRSSNQNPLCEIVPGRAYSQVSPLRQDQVGPGCTVESVSVSEHLEMIITDHSQKCTSKGEPKLVACLSVIGLLHCQCTQEVLGCLLVSAYVQAFKRQSVSISLTIKNVRKHTSHAHIIYCSSVCRAEVKSFTVCTQGFLGFIAVRQRRT